MTLTRGFKRFFFFYEMTNRIDFMEYFVFIKNLKKRTLSLLRISSNIIKNEICLGLISKKCFKLILMYIFEFVYHWNYKWRFVIKTSERKRVFGAILSEYRPIQAYFIITWRTEIISIFVFVRLLNIVDDWQVIKCQRMNCIQCTFFINSKRLNKLQSSKRYLVWKTYHIEIFLLFFFSYKSWMIGTADYSPIELWCDRKTMDSIWKHNAPSINPSKKPYNFRIDFAAVELNFFSSSFSQLYAMNLWQNKEENNKHLHRSLFNSSLPRHSTEILMHIDQYHFCPFASIQSEQKRKLFFRIKFINLFLFSGSFLIWNK